MYKYSAPIDSELRSSAAGQISLRSSPLVNSVQQEVSHLHRSRYHVITYAADL